MLCVDRIYILTQRFNNNRIEVAFTTKMDLFDYIQLHIQNKPLTFLHSHNLIIVNKGKFEWGESPIIIPGHTLLEYRDKPFPIGEKDE